MQLVVIIKKDNTYLPIPMLYSSREELEEEIDKRLDMIEPMLKEIRSAKLKAGKLECTNAFNAMDEHNQLWDRIHALQHELECKTRIIPNLVPKGEFGFDVGTNKFTPVVYTIDEWFNSFFDSFD